jgi:hypothetical protein
MYNYVECFKLSCIRLNDNMMNVIILSVKMLNSVMLSVIMLSVIILKGIMLSVIMTRVAASHGIDRKGGCQYNKTFYNGIVQITFSLVLYLRARQ